MCTYTVSALRFITIKTTNQIGAFAWYICRSNHHKKMSAFDCKRLDLSVGDKCLQYSHQCNGLLRLCFNGINKIFQLQQKNQNIWKYWWSCDTLATIRLFKQFVEIMQKMSVSSVIKGIVISRLSFGEETPSNYAC